jgi:hypothetical protein
MAHSVVTPVAGGWSRLVIVFLCCYGKWLIAFSFLFSVLKEMREVTA